MTGYSTASAPSPMSRALAAALLCLLPFLPPASLRANYGYACTHCSGTDGLCPDCGGEGNDAWLSGSGLPGLLGRPGWLDASGGLDGFGGLDAVGWAVPAAASSTGGDPSFGSLRLFVPFGRPLHEDLDLQGGFSLYAILPSPAIYTPRLLQYRNRLLDRILVTEVARASAAAVLGEGWESRLSSSGEYGRVVLKDGLPQGATHQVRLLGAKREAVVFLFMDGDPAGRPTGDMSTLRLALRMRDGEGRDCTSCPVFYDLCFGNGDSVRYAASDGRVVSCTTSSGRTVTPACAGLDAVWGADGLVRQVWSAVDGLAEVSPLDGAQGFEIRLYAPGQVAGTGPDGLYAASGEPHTVWRVTNPDGPSVWNRALVSRVSGGAEETTSYEYSRVSEGWTMTSPGGASVTSSTATPDLSRTVRDVTVTVRTPGGRVSSRQRNEIRRLPFGERVTRSVQDPGGAALETARDYYGVHDGPGSRGRLRLETRPDGGWTAWRYDGQGRVAAETTPWKDSPRESPDGLARAVLYSYAPVDPRDTPLDGDARPRVEETRVLGSTVSKTFHAYYTEDGRRVEAEERCVRPGAAYGDPDNLRTVRRYHPAGDGAASVSAGRLHTVLGEDGSLATYAYERGAWTPGSGGEPGEFTPGSGGSLRVTSTAGTPASPAGVAFRTLRRSLVLDASGNAVFMERQVFTGDGYERLDWAEAFHDGRGRQVRVRRSDGRTSEASWGCCAKVSETLPDGRTYLYGYDALKRPVSKTLLGFGGQPDHVTEYAYDASGRVVSSTVSGGGLSLSSATEYDLAGRVASSTDEAGRRTVYSRMAGENSWTGVRGERTEAVLPGGACTATERHCDGRVKSVTGDAQTSRYYDYGVNADGTQWTEERLGGASSPRWTRTTVDMLGRVVKTEKPGCGVNSVIVQQNTYDAAGRLVRTTQTGLADTLYEYDELGELIRTGQDADGNGTLDLASNDRITDNTTAYMQDNNDDWWLRSEQKVYATDNDSAPTMVSASERRGSGFANGVVSETRSTDIHGNTVVTTTSIDRAARTVTVESLSPGSAVAEQRVTVNGLVVSIRSRSNLTTTYGYDGLRRRVSATNPRTGTSTVTYDAQGRVSSETDAAGGTTSYGYDAAGRLAWRRDALNKYARYAYNPRGQQVRAWGDTEYPVEYGYDQYGQRVAMTTFRAGASWDGEAWPNPAPQGDTTTWNYDEATGLLLSKAYAGGHGPAYAYTADGKLASRTWARKDGQGNDLATNYSYNLFGELIGIDYSDTTPDVTYAYNRAGKLSQVTDVVGTRTFTYNNTLDEVSETITGLYSKTLTRTNTSSVFKGKRQGLSVDNVSHYTYGYDAYGRMDRITIPSGSFNYTRLANSDLVSQMTRPNGIATAWSYEPHRDLITQIQNGTVSAYGYVNDAIGRRTSMSRSGGAHPNPDTVSYAYNDRSELTGASSSVDTVCSYSYAYDPVGNRLTASEGGVPWTYTTNSLNQYASATENNVQLDFAYDLDGSMTYRPVDATGGWTQTWNCENRMVETFKGSDRLTFKYDYMGRRVEKCVYSGDILTSRTLYVYDGFKCVEELDGLAGNAVLRRHAWQPFNVGLDVILATTDATGTSYFLHDANKNVMQKTDTNGALLEKYAYAPFGGNTGEARASIGFSSEAFDAATDLDYYNYRYYAPGLGRWTKRDPIGERGGEALNAFSGNNPITLIDHLGLACCYGQRYNSLYQGCCHTAKQVFNRFTQCCIEGEGVYQRSDSWDVKICFGSMGLGLIRHVWIESGDKAYGFYSDPNGFFPPVLDCGQVRLDEVYSKRKESNSIFSHWNDESYKYCVTIHLSKCRYDIEKFNYILDHMPPFAFYSIFGEYAAPLDLIGMTLAINLPKYIDFISIPFNNIFVKDCHSAAYAMIAEAARKSKR